MNDFYKNTNKIERVEICDFRGIKGPSTISFPNNTSIIIIGDNGSGKSSIVDAIEFCLQGHVRRNCNFEHANRESLFSFIGGASPKVTVHFKDNTSHKRELDPKSRYFVDNDYKSHPEFSRAVFTFRRSDLLDFDNAGAENRVRFLMDFFGTKGNEFAGASQRIIDELDISREGYKKLIIERFNELCFLTAFKPHHEAHILSPENFENEFNKIRRSKFVPKEAHRIADKIRELLVPFKEVTDDLAKRRAKQSLNFSSADTVARSIVSECEEKLLKRFILCSETKNIKSFRLERESKLGISAHIELTNGKSATPGQVFSEANRDLFALLFFITILEFSSKNGQQKLLILDDVLQSIDHTFRQRFMEMLVAEFKDWQLIITTHDRYWAQSAKQLLSKMKFGVKTLSLGDWSLDSGAQIYEQRKKGDYTFDEIIDSDDPELICGRVGILHERLCHEIAEIFDIGVKYKASGKYTLGDMWPSLSAQLLKTNLHPTIESINSVYSLRNAVGAHYNPSAGVASRKEIEKYARSICELNSQVFCATCSKFVARVGDFNKWECKCGALKVAI